jgi:hypothetical protein
MEVSQFNAGFDCSYQKASQLSHVSSESSNKSNQEIHFYVRNKRKKKIKAFSVIDFSRGDSSIHGSEL